MRIGAHYTQDKKCEFTVWAPFAKDIKLKIIPESRYVDMERNQAGYWKKTLEDIPAGTTYLYKIDDLHERPDPASFSQPQGVHGPSSVVDHGSFPWDDNAFKGVALPEMVIYEIHTGTFTPQGDFYGVIPRIKELVQLGVTALELMPVAQFPGSRNWGYDGVYPFAVQNSYGGDKGLKELVNEAHAYGLSVILDVVYNHLGPEGNYFSEYGPYFTDKYQSIWGRAVNFDDAYSLEVRNFFIENALYWFEYYHIDGLRLDAVHGIYDMGAKHILEELTQNINIFSQRKKRKYYLIAESDLNDVRIIKPQIQGGYGIDAQWNDDFHHSLHTLLTGEKNGYYIDFPDINCLAKSFQDGFLYQGNYSDYRKKCHGNSSKDIPAHQFIVFSQNHDQVGNRMLGERLTSLVSFEALKLSAAAVILSPYIPLLFMGEEYAEDNPFMYFVSHSDEQLIKNVREGRKKEFTAFGWQGETPDAQDEQTFLKSKLNWQTRNNDKHAVMLKLYKQLLIFRKTLPALKKLDKHSLEVFAGEKEKMLFWRRWYNRNELFCVMNFNEQDNQFVASTSEGSWKKLMDSSQKDWQGPGSALPDVIKNNQTLSIKMHSFALFQKEVLK